MSTKLSAILCSTKTIALNNSKQS